MSDETANPADIGDPDYAAGARKQRTIYAQLKHDIVLQMKLTLIVFFQLVVLNAFSQSGITDSAPNRIDEERFININGIDQWVTIKGDKSNPAVLFLHGGPGSPITPFADALYGSWEKDFILVQWDQRGTGRTYGRNAPEELTPEFLRSNPLTIAQMTSDGVELARYLTQYLGKEKIILFGTSWGSVLGVKMATSQPDLFYAYIGHSQMVDPSSAALLAFEKVYRMAEDAKDRETLDALNSMGKPPYSTARNTGLFLRAVKKYQQKNSTPAPSSWIELHPDYDNEKDNRDRSDGDDYSFVNYAGDQALGIVSLSSTINFLRDGLLFKMPVYFIQGEADIQTPHGMTKEYFRKLKAPEKKLILLPKTDHGFNQSVVDAHYQIMRNFVLPVIQGGQKNRR